MIRILLASLVLIALCPVAFAEPIRLTEDQMDAVTAAGRPTGFGAFPFTGIERTRVVVFADEVVIIIKVRDPRRFDVRRFDRVIVPPLFRSRFETIPRFHDLDRFFDGGTRVRVVIR